jgi:hypothetical protein
MKFLTIAVLFSICTSVSAQNNEVLAKAKEHALSNIDKRIGYLNELKSCISNAADKAGIKSCRATHKTQVSGLKDTNKAWRETMKAERKQK